MICNCALAGTDACNSCPNNKMKYEQAIKYITYNEIKQTDKPLNGFPVIQYWCSNCDALLNKYAKYCHNCGIKIDWEMMTED